MTATKAAEQLGGTTVIYTRVSTVEQAEKQSLDNQEKICRDFAAKRDQVVDRVFIEAGASAKTADRLQLLAMLTYCQQSRGRIKFVIVYKMDRFARRAEDHLTLRAGLLKMGIQLLSATEPIENTITGKLMETILAGFAEFDNGVRGERSKGGMKTRLEQGCWVHMAPIGYRNIRDSQKRPTLEPDGMAPKVQALFKEFRRGIYTQKQAVQLALDLGITTKKGKAVSTNGVYKMLRNPIYTGMVASSMLSAPVVGLHKPLISTEDLNGVTGILGGRKRAILPEARGKPLWPLRRFSKCGNCHHPLTGSTSRGRNSTYSYYHCTKCKGKVRVQREEAHQQFQALLERVRPSSGSLGLFREIVLKRWNDEFREVQEQRRKLEDRLRECEDDKNALVEKNIRGVVDDDTYQLHADRLTVRMGELKLARTELYEGELEKEVIVDFGIRFMADASGLWQAASLDNRQRFQKMIFPDGITYNFGTGFGTAKMSACYEEIALEQAEKQNEAASSATSSEAIKTLVAPRGVEPRLPG